MVKMKLGGINRAAPIKSQNAAEISLGCRIPLLFGEGCRSNGLAREAKFQRKSREESVLVRRDFAFCGERSRAVRPDPLPGASRAGERSIAGRAAGVPGPVLWPGRNFRFPAESDSLVPAWLPREP